MKMYCMKCGEGIEYALEKPNFCPDCRYPFTTEAKEILARKAAKTPAKPTKVVEDTEEEDEDDEPEEKVVAVHDEEVDVEVSGMSRLNRNTFEDVITTSKAGFVRHITKGKKVDRKQVLKEFKKEAGSLRKG